MNFEFIEGRKTGDNVGKFGWMRIAYEEVVSYKGERGGVGVVAEEHGGGSFGVTVLGKGGRQGGAEIRAPIGEGQAQFLRHHRTGTVCRGSDGGREEDRF